MDFQGKAFFQETWVIAIFGRRACTVSGVTLPLSSSIALAVPQAAASGMACGGALQVFIEVYGTRPLLVVCGGGHVGTCVLRAAKLTGFELWLFDDRPQEVDWL